MFHATFGARELTTFCRLDELGLVTVGQRLRPDRAVLECRVADDGCRYGGGRGRPLGTDSADSLMNRSVAGPRRRYRCTACARFWSQDTSAAAEPRAKISRGGLAWARRALVIDHLSISRAAAELGVAWKTANDAVLTEGHRRLINDPTRLDSVAVLGVDEHVWRHTRFGEAITSKHNSSLNSWVNRRRDAVMLRLSFSSVLILRGPTVRNP